MWTCHKCGKPVYFAERKQSLGYDWHPECLRCDECGKRLNPGQHAEHKGVPYCDVPCYSFLFGPTLFGHGSQVESHTSFGKGEKRLPPGIDRGVLETKLKSYNQYYEGNSCQLKWKERNGKLVLEGVLRIYWGVNRLIHLKENEDQRHHVQIRKRNSYREAIATTNDNGEDRYLGTNDLTKYLTLPGRSRNPLYRENGATNQNDEHANKITVNVTSADSETTNEKLHSESRETETKSDAVVVVDVDGAKQSEVSIDGKDVGNEGRVVESVNRSLLSVENDDSTDGDDDISTKPKREKVDLSHVQIRKMTSSRSKTKLKRRCSINGHFYNKETKTFKPPYGSVSNVWVTSMVTTEDVINMLLDKFCIENNPEEFALFIVRDNGEIRRLKDDDFPLLVRILLGPHEEVSKVFIMDRNKTEEISNEVAQYLNFQEPELAAILRKFTEEEGRETKKIKLKYNEMRRIIKTRLAILRNSQLQQQQPNGS